MKKLLKIIQNSRKQILLMIIISTVVGVSVYFLKPNFYVTEFPYIDEKIAEILKENEEWVCDSAVYSHLSAYKDSIYEKRDGIKGRVEKGTDKVNIKIEGDVLQFNTRAGFDMGFMEGEPFAITRNDGEYLVAIDTNEQKAYVDTFILEKSTGLATWTKNRTEPFFQLGHPDAQSLYLICR